MREKERREYKGGLGGRNKEEHNLIITSGNQIILKNVIVHTNGFKKRSHVIILIDTEIKHWEIPQSPHGTNASLGTDIRHRKFFMSQQE